MKLNDLVNSINSKVREVANFIRYPLENVSRIMRQKIQGEYSKIEIPFMGQEHDQKKQFVEEIKVQCSAKNNRESSLTVRDNYVSNGALAQKVDLLLPPKSTNRIEILPLKRNDEIRGRRGRYRVNSNSIIKTLDRARLYEGIQITNNKQILIKEYLLPEADFNLKEARKCKEEFEELASVNLKKIGGQDFRLIIPWDAIAPRDERRCYLITEPIENSITLREYLEQTNRPMISLQVRELLKQVLQTLWFIHNQKIRLPNGEVRYGLPHGNLSLDSIFIVQTEEKSLVETPQFFIYLGDLALWEDLFKPRNLPPVNHSVTKDLNDLGYLSFYLLLGGNKDPLFGQAFNPKNEQHWSTVDDIYLKIFIQSLLGINSPFANAEQARQSLLAAPFFQKSSVPKTQIEIEETQKKFAQIFNYKIFKIGIISCAVGLISFLLIQAFINKSSMEKSTISNASSPQTKKIKDVDIKGIPPYKFRYTASKSEGTWDSIIYDVSRSKRTSLVSFGKTFEQELQERGMTLNLTYQTVAAIDNNTFTMLKNKQTDFLIINLVNNFDKKLQQNEFSYSKIAYDGIVIFVPFSDSQRNESISEGLKGKITFAQLRKLYTRQITSWKQLDRRLPDLKITLYIPNEEEVIDRFKAAVFKDYPEELNRFRDLIATGEIIKQDTRKTLGKQILGEFENEDKAGIGFGLLSKVFGQCSVYPLSLGQPGKEIQTLIQNNGHDINPKTDLCNDKGSYRPNIDVFEKNKYPLGYEITVIYPKPPETSTVIPVGEKFAEILLTDEGQYLIREAGLVPIVKKN
ncbi:substrate-binding domain-containing protein [Anabaena catenula]|uniref:Substrate-binding domain-containing protein n=1 Tax=Anabaena catenula FACHB-362 TaxID=2692877 RepID=A0ABR8J3A6_9NOST|nr:substrate-binding domain-containing protein [Anabaena catenula]MBD2692103.1 substrate-binding domain-containing protein [Anabaena catenula FACHB-362]